jgi:tight adherence protein B
MRTPYLLLVSGLVFIAALMAITFLYWGWRSREEEKSRHIARRLGTLVEGDEDSVFRLMSVKDPVAEAMGEWGQQLEGMLRQANSSYGLQGLVSRMGFWALAGVTVAGVVLRSPIAVVGIGLGAIPLLLVSSQATERAGRMSEQLPDALDLIARSLQAGHGLSDAIRLCAEEMQPPISQEFGRVYEEHNLGRDFRDCLNNLISRNPRNFDLKIFVSSLLLARETGGNLIEILNNISKTVRERFVFETKVKAMTAEARFSAIILGGLPFALLGIIYMMRPEYLTPLFNDPLGRTMLMVAGTMFTLGVMVMRRISQVQL